MEQRIVVSGKELIKIAKTTSPIGMKGGVKTAPLFFNATELDEVLSLCSEELYLIRGNEFPKKVSLSSSKPSSNFLELSFKGLQTRTDAEKLSRLDVYVLFNVYSKYLRDTNSVFGYIGFSVKDKVLGVIGKVAGISRHAQTLLVIDDGRGGKEKLVPFVKEFVVFVDYDNKLITTTLPEGIFE